MSLPLLEDVACNLCGSRGGRALFDRPYTARAEDSAVFAATTDEFQDYGRIVRCLDCGLVYTNPRPSAACLAEGYGACVDESYLAESSSRSINAHLSLRTIKRFVGSGRLLEIGCATGYFLNAARADFDVAGLDLSQWACEVARRRFRLDVYAEDFLRTTRFPAGSFDAIALIDVIEHLTDPKAALARAAEWLRPGGVLYLVTPDIGSLSARLLRGYWWGLRPAHIYYFDRSSMRRMLRDHGLEPVLVKSFGRIFSYAYWVSRLRHYPRPVHASVSAAVRWLDIGDKLLYLDTRDSMEICAVKR
ncbi:MAG: class I SAM-dependent methyltransferase [Elusimicrobia bacterium]|nr:class I SAM-dependent methyltransferase [Elusimicrobiota bacterium]